ncbi:MAG: PAS domain-containing protein, partial [Verrucomicrobiota bacterium]
MTKAVQQGNQQELEIHQIELEMQNEDLRQMHVQLDTALARYTDLYDFAPVGYMTIRPDGVIQQTNLAAASLLGIERLHLLGWRFGMFVAVEARADFNALVARAIETKASEVGEVGLSVKGKPPLTVQLRISVSAGGQECRLVLIDITERRQAEEQLGEHRAFLDNVLEGTHPGTWGWNVQTGQAQVNARWAEMLGYTLAELAPITIQTWLALVHPADLKNSDAARDAHFNRTADIYECEFRMKHKDGSWVWMEDRGRVVEWTSDNKPLLMAGTHLDITVRKRAEYQLDERRKELEAFFGLAALGAKTGITLDEIYQDFVNLLPASWQYPK